MYLYLFLALAMDVQRVSADHGHSSCYDQLATGGSDA